MKRLDREEVIFVAIDFQERLMPAMRHADKVIASAAKLTKGLSMMGVPILVTQQNTAGMGPTVGRLAAELGDFEPVEKSSFGCMETPEFVSRLEAAGRKKVIVGGCETHICVQNTVLDLLEAGYEVWLVADCVSSRKRYTRDIAIETMRQAGAFVTTHESVLFDLLKTHEDENFKAISKLIK